MEGNHGVYSSGRQVGKVTVRRTGLYYSFRCRCMLDGEILCRLQVRCGDKQENLGVLVPMEDGFGLDTKLPVKRLGEGTPEFFLAVKPEKTSGTFAPIYPEEPFTYISRLKEGYLVRKDGMVGLMLK